MSLSFKVAGWFFGRSVDHIVFDETDVTTNPDEGGMDERVWRVM